MSVAAEEVVPGIYLARIPLPRNPLRTVNSYIIPSKDVTYVVDLGFDLPECRTALNEALRELSRPWSSVQVIATHSHPDHIGLLASLPENNLPTLAGFASLTEIHEFRARESVVGSSIKRQMQEDLARGILVPQVKTLSDIEERAGAQAATEPKKVIAELPPEYNVPAGKRDVVKLNKGDCIAAGPYHFEVMTVPGHDYWHICLHDKSKGVLIVGDHVLRRITPMLSTWLPECDVLKDYTDSLRRTPKDNIRIVLPAHGNPFADIGCEIERILSHCSDRKGEILRLVEQGFDNAPAIAANAKWRYTDWFEWSNQQQIFSVGETQAHLFRLSHEGLVKYEVEGRYSYRFLRC